MNLMLDLKDLRDQIDGFIDGHSWGQENVGGPPKIFLSDFQDILDKLNGIIKKYESDT